MFSFIDSRNGNIENAGRKNVTRISRRCRQSTSGTDQLKTNTYRKKK